jgi:hypothetical protein
MMPKLTPREHLVFSKMFLLQSPLTGVQAPMEEKQICLHTLIWLVDGAWRLRSRLDFPTTQCLESLILNSLRPTLLLSMHQSRSLVHVPVLLQEQIQEWMNTPMTSTQWQQREETQLMMMQIHQA